MTEGHIAMVGLYFDDGRVLKSMYLDKSDTGGNILRLLWQAPCQRIERQYLVGGRYVEFKVPAVRTEAEVLVIESSATTAKQIDELMQVRTEADLRAALRGISYRRETIHD